MNSFKTQGIVLTRVDFEEAARIVTFLTSSHGKVRAIAKGVRKSQSKLAGGIELFSVSDLSFLVGRGEIYTLISARLVKHYGNIVKNIDRTNAGYEFIMLINKATEDAAEEDYFKLLEGGLKALNDDSIDLGLAKVWYSAQLLKLSGHTPNLRTDEAGHKLLPKKKYSFDLDSMNFVTGKDYNTDHIKFLRLVFSDNQPPVLQKVQGIGKLAAACAPLVQSMLQSFVRT